MLDVWLLITSRLLMFSQHWCVTEFKALLWRTVSFCKLWNICGSKACEGSPHTGTCHGSSPSMQYHRCLWREGGDIVLFVIISRNKLLHAPGMLGELLNRPWVLLFAFFPIENNFFNIADFCGQFNPGHPAPLTAGADLEPSYRGANPLSKVLLQGKELLTQITWQL